jgi:hypothetical protein
MTTMEIAHVREQGIDLIVIPLDSSFGRKSTHAQHEVINELQARSRSAGLNGTVVPVWDNGGGRMAFIAQRNWHAFFQSIGLNWVYANLNRQLSW